MKALDSLDFFPEIIDFHLLWSDIISIIYPAMAFAKISKTLPSFFNSNNVNFHKKNENPCSFFVINYLTCCEGKR